jgi:hypothetical protein
MLSFDRDNPIRGECRVIKAKQLKHPSQHGFFSAAVDARARLHLRSTFLVWALLATVKGPQC